MKVSSKVKFAILLTTYLASAENSVEEETPSNLTLDMDSFALEEAPHQALLGLFAKKSVVKVHEDRKNTGNLEYGPELRKLTMKLLSHGIAATAINVFYDSLFQMFEKSFNVDTKTKPPESTESFTKSRIPIERHELALDCHHTWNKRYVSLLFD